MPSSVGFAKGSATWFDSVLEVDVRFAGRESKHSTQTRRAPGDLGVFCERAATCRYGGTGVVMGITKCAGLPNKGTSITAARRLACTNTQVNSALRRTPPSRASFYRS